MKLFYKKLGEGKPLFILHGLFGMSDNWNTVGKILSKHFEVYLIDLRNHGNSPHSDEWTYPAMANDIYELCILTESPIREGENKIILMGHSLGGKVAMQFVFMYPEKLEKLIVADMAPKDYSENQFDFIEKLLAINLSEMKSRKETETELRKTIWDESTIRLLLKNIKLNTSHKYLHARMSSYGKEEESYIPTIEWKFNLKVIAENQNKIGNTFSIKSNIEIPSLFIRGEKSNYISNSDIPQIKKYFPNSEIKTIAGAGHWVHADKPYEFAAEVNKFAIFNC